MKPKRRDPGSIPPARPFRHASDGPRKPIPRARRRKAVIALADASAPATTHFPVNGLLFP